MGRSFEPSPIENFFFFFFFLWLFMEGLCYHCYVMGSWAYYIPCKIRPILLECSSGSVSTAKMDIDRPPVHRLVPFSLPFHFVLNTSDSFKIKFSQAPGIGTRRVQQMGASESLLARQSPIQQSRFVDEITTVSERTEGVDPLVERIRALKIATPLLKSSQSESSLTDILLKKPSSGSGTLNPDVLLELFSIYREWQEKKSKEISQKQEELENKIETVDALAAKLLQRFTYSVSAMRSTSQSLAEVYPLQVEVGELKGRLNEVISNCDALCKRISALGPEALGTTITPFSPSIAREKEDSKLQENKPEISKSDV